MPAADDLDWVRRRLEEVEHRTWARPTSDVAAHTSLLDVADSLRTIVSVGDAEQIRAFRAAWEARMRDDGDTGIDSAVADLVRSASADVTAAEPVRDEEPAQIDETADLDWVRRRIVELDDRQRELPPTDIAARHAILQTVDDLRRMIRSGHAEQLHAVREGWEARAGRKGDHEVDYEAIAGMVRSMMPSQGR